jgi:hypothetical protein
MAYSTDFGFTNRDATAARAVPLYDMDITSNYALQKDEPTECRLVNTTAAVDREEILSYRCKDLTRVNTNLNIQNPSPVQGGVQYQVVMEALLTSENPDTGFRVDEPIVTTISVRHPKSGFITPDHVATMIGRTASAFETDAGQWRIKELMRSALKPTED